MPNLPRWSRWLPAIVAVALLALTACGGGRVTTHDPAPPPDTLVVNITNEGKATVVTQEYVTDQPSLPLRLVVVNTGNSTFKSGPMWDKVITVASLGRTDHTSPMRLGGITMVNQGNGKYGGWQDLLLPLGTYSLQIDDKPTGMVITVKPKSSA
jgi:hypothetical protein